MKRTVLLAVLLSFMLVLPALQAQVSFFQAPTFQGGGSLFVADFNGDGKLDILCSNTSGSLLNLGKGDGTFGQVTAVPGTTLAVADFNGDGKLDLLQQTTGTLHVLLGNGDGTFQPATSTPSGASLQVVAAADVNGDGKVDVVGVSGSAVLVYLGKGDGTFGAPLSSSLGSSATPTVFLSIADFNGDGKLDIAISNVTTPGTGILLGNGDGRFKTAVFPANLSNFYAEFVADVNNDHKPDLVASSAQVALGNGDGTFTVAPAVSCTICSVSAVADLTGDGKPDLITMDNQAILTQIYLGNGDGTFTYVSTYFPQMEIPGNLISSGLAVGDFNSDGKPDIAFNGAILLGNGNGTFQGIPVGYLPNAEGSPNAVTGDFDNNGTVDVAMTSDNVTTPDSVYILSNDETGHLTLAHTYPLQQTGPGVATADFNGDGKLDLLVLGIDPTSRDWSYSVLLGNGDGTFQSAVFNPQGVTGVGPPVVVVADFNHDGKPDIATTISGQLAVLLGHGDGTFAAPVYYYDAGYSNLMVADFNGDGKLDVVVGNSGLGVVGTAILFGNGDGTFQTAVLPPNLNNFAAALTADLNNDGKPDLVGMSQVALGNGDGTFNLLPAMPCPGMMTCGVSAIADINGDGKLDAIVSEVFSRLGLNLDIRLGNGDGTFGPDITVQTNGQGVLVADMNGDGQPDLVFPSFPGPAVLFNTTAPGFTINPASGSPTSKTINAGQTASFSLVVGATGKFSGTVNLNCAVTPAVTPALPCTLSSSSVQISGSGSQSLTVKVGTTQPLMAGTGSDLDSWPRAMLLMSTSVLVGSAWLLIPKKKRLSLAAALMIVLALVSCVSCGGGSSTSMRTMPATPPGTYTATVTGTSGKLSYSFPLQVVVH